MREYNLRVNSALRGKSASLPASEGTGGKAAHGELKPWQGLFVGRIELNQGAKRLSLSKTNNSTGAIATPPRKPSAKAGEVLRLTVDDYTRRNEARAVHFVTLTVPDGLEDERELSRRVNSIRDALLVRYAGGVRVYERHKSGAVHVHLVLVFRAPKSLRAPSWVKLKGRQTLRAPGASWLELWSWWRDVAERYGFGRVECLPVRKPEAAGSYCSKYLSKGEHSWERGTRLYAVWKLRVTSQSKFSFSGGMARTHRDFMRWLTDGQSEEDARARMDALWGNRWMRVIWWHVKNGLEDDLFASFWGFARSGFDWTEGDNDSKREARASLEWAAL